MVVLICDVIVIYLGYGFLVENVRFVEICVDYDIIFIGLFLVGIRVMGDKFIVKEIM